MNWLQLVMGIIPAIPFFVHGVETLAGHGNGTQKKLAVQQLVAASLQVTSTVAPHSADTIDKITPAVGSLIDGVVDIFNKTGVFKQQAPAPQAAVAAAAGASVGSF